MKRLLIPLAAALLIPISTSADITIKDGQATPATHTMGAVNVGSIEVFRSVVCNPTTLTQCQLIDASGYTPVIGGGGAALATNAAQTTAQTNFTSMDAKLSSIDTHIQAPIPASTPTVVIGAVGPANLDPCGGNAVTYAPLNIASGTTTLIATGVAGKKVYVCSLFVLPAGAAVNFALTEGTGATCGTGTAGVLGHQSTAGMQAQLATNGGTNISAGGQVSVARTATVADSLCIVTSAAMAAGINYVIF